MMIMLTNNHWNKGAIENVDKVGSMTWKVGLYIKLGETLVYEVGLKIGL